MTVQTTGDQKVLPRHWTGTKSKEEEKDKAVSSKKIIQKKFSSSLSRQSSEIKSRSQNVVRTSVTHSAIASCATFLILPHFDVICDLLLNRRTATWNLFILYNNETNYSTIDRAFYFKIFQHNARQWFSRNRACIFRTVVKSPNPNVKSFGVIPRHRKNVSWKHAPKLDFMTRKHW